MHLSSYGIYHDSVQLDCDARNRFQKFEDGLMKLFNEDIKI
jgi:hypothetical protein